MLNVIRILIIGILVFCFRITYAQPKGRIVEPITPIAPEDTLKPGTDLHPVEPKLIVETDQRFFYFKTHFFPGPDRLFMRVYGARAGVLLPKNIKVGAGIYFTGQRMNHFWNGYIVQQRRLQYFVAYIEPFYFRRKYWELSSPLEVGIGTSRYVLSRVVDLQPSIQSSIAIPIGLGLSVSLKSQAIHKFRPFRWLGFNATAGYRLTLQPGVPESPVSYNGFYYSAGPTLMLSRVYADYKAWRKNRTIKQKARLNQHK